MSNFYQQSQEVKGDQYNADTIYFRAPLSLSEKQQQNYRAYMINQVHCSWIMGVLEPSVGEHAPIIQGLQMQPGMVVNPFDACVQESRQSTHTQPPQTSIVHVYDQVNGRLLIVGEPGAGKTTLLLELARELLDRARADETRQLPVIFHLSSWAEKRQSLADWLVEELQRKYYVQKELARESIAANYLLLLLDGLDEVAPSARAACIEAINSYQKEHGPCPMVVCSRKEEYLASRHRMELNNAVMVLPLTQEQIDAYLQSMGGSMEAVRMALQHDVPFHELIITPLMLNIVTRAYQGQPVEDLLVEETPEARQRQVFATYVEQMLTRRSVPKAGTKEQIIKWLTFLATQLAHTNQSVFYLEHLQPSWLADQRAKRWYYRSLGLLMGLLVGPFLGALAWMNKDVFNEPHTWLIQDVPLVLFIWLLSVLFGGLLSELFIRRFPALTKKAFTITPGERMSWSWQKVRSQKRGRMLIVLPLLLLVGSIFGLFVGMGTASCNVMRIDARLFGLGIGLLSFLLSTLPIGLLLGLSQSQLDERARLSPNQGIWHSLKNGLLLGALVGLPIGLLFGLYLWVVFGLGGSCMSSPDGVPLSVQPLINLLVVMPAALLLGLVLGINGGLLIGAAFLYHFVLRFWLWRTRALPWNLIAFLDEATSHLILRRVGGGYMFIHRLLLDYLAALETAPEARPASEPSP